MVEQLSSPLGLSVLSKFNFPHKIGILDRLYGRKLAAQGHRWVKINQHLTWKLDLNESPQRWIVYDSYEGRYVTAWIKSLFKDGGVSIESGSNYGQTLLYYADLADKIIAIDPLKDALNWLSECIDHNQLTNIEMLNVGLSNKKTTLTLQHAGAQSTFRDDWYQSKNHLTSKVQCLPLDELVEQLQIDQVQFWKLDVEGMDYEALQGAQRLLSEKRIYAMYIEITGGNFDKVKDLLGQYGYGLFIIDKNLQPQVLEKPQNLGTTTYISLSM